jgi:general secretion pathway protein D
LIREDVQKLDDKIPFLGDIPIAGRLFRSKTTVRNKRNLLIFVTARLIDPAGNPIHRQPV